ncbi:MAG TPA: tetratricopeptide repeat protein, partial [Tepidisphaeraceae bacterium]|nr:tetratricopeptide repeat protein [Tepidisphaeraceae bacterium]
MAEIPIQEAFEHVRRHREAGRHADADALYQHVVSQLPADPAALHGLGIYVQQSGNNAAAADLLGRAAKLDPNSADLQDHLGVALALLGRWEEAAAAWESAIQLHPTAEVALNLANALRRIGRSDEAIARYQQAIELKPGVPAAHNNLGNLLREQGQPDAAIASFQRAIAIKPDYVEALNNLAGTLLEQGQPEEAIELYREALSLRTEQPALHNNLGKALRALNRTDDAIAAHQLALALDRNDADAHWNRGLMLLLKGELAAGWEEYEWRWRVPEFRSPRRNFSQPLWSGEPLAGRRILLHAEQGFGDTLQFVRYAPMVAQLGGRVILECPAELCRLMQTVPGIEQIVPTGQPLPAFDVHCPMLSLPRAFRTTLQTIPQQVPYLSADPARTRFWAERLRFPTDRLRVGFAWAGRPDNPNDRIRSIAVPDLAPLAACKGVAFYNLQTGVAAS